MKILDWNSYIEMFDAILDKKITGAPYDNTAYLEYVQLNKVRTQRWLKKLSITEDSVDCLKNITQEQHWILITEPWCGDAAHNTPFLFMLSELNPLIHLEIVLRDSNSLIDSYLTNGGKSIPKLVVRDSKGSDLFTWGPRPKEAQELVLRMKAEGSPYEEVNKEIQQWYNKDKGISVQREIVALLKP
jgi:hypothetical protein